MKHSCICCALTQYWSYQKPSRVSAERCWKRNYIFIFRKTIKYIAFKKITAPVKTFGSSTRDRTIQDKTAPLLMDLCHCQHWCLERTYSNHAISCQQSPHRSHTAPPVLGVTVCISSINDQLRGVNQVQIKRYKMVRSRNYASCSHRKAWDQGEVKPFSASVYTTV